MKWKSEKIIGPSLSSHFKEYKNLQRNVIYYIPLADNNPNTVSYFYFRCPCTLGPLCTAIFGESDGKYIHTLKIESDGTPTLGASMSVSHGKRCHFYLKQGILEWIGDSTGKLWTSKIKKRKLWTSKIKKRKLWASKINCNEFVPNSFIVALVGEEDDNR